MESSSLFNPGFLGGSFYWFIGQVADDSTWRENQNPGKFEEISEMPAWGYRYKVRIIGQHEQDESEVTAEDLPWAQVMYPVTAGSGQGGSYQSPAIKQGMFVFGFFLDGKDQQTPIIMGCLGNNAKTKLERKTGTEGSGGKNFTPQSFYSKNQDEEPVEQKHLKDGDLAPKQAGNRAFSSSSKSNVTVEASDANNIKTIADRKKYDTLTEKHSLGCPNPDTQSDTKNMQTVISTLTKTIESFQQSLTDADAAVGLPILKNDKNIDKAIDNASQEMAKFMKGTMNKLQQFTTKEFNEKLAPMENLAPPSHSLELLNKKVEGLEKIACMFNGMAGLALAGLIAAALRRAFNRKKRRAEEAAAINSVSNAGVVNATLAAGIGTDGLVGTDAVVGGTDILTGTTESRVGITSSQTIPSTPVLDTPGASDVPPLTADGFYRPTPLCETEEIVGEVMGGTINTIMAGFDSAIGPVIDEIQNSLGGSSTETGSENVGTIDHAINENNVLSSLSSGALILSFSQSVADQAGIDPNSVGDSNRYWADGNYGRGLTGFIDAAGQNTPDNQQLIANALSLIDDKSNPTGIAEGLALTSNVLGVNQNLLLGIGLAFAAIRSGGIPDLISSVGNLAAFNPRILNAVVGGGAALGGGALAGGIGLGALGGMSFDIASALNFVNSITKIFNCDPDPECSPNDEHTMQSGGGSAGRPSTSSIAESARNISGSVKERKSYGTGIEKLNSSKEGVKIKKKFAKPKTRTQDLTNLVGYVNGQPYYGPFHIHEREDGRVVKMVGIAHTTTPHEIIYDTVQESLD
tara:strand:- start:1510 stop:3921 length:2412 start_codon:yes stop_codon:yes gene_type:complete